jgi:exodeoxyribonuclease-3
VKRLKLLCWNVNGVRAAAKKGLGEWLVREAPDVACLQETKAQPEQLNDIVRRPPGYQTFWSIPKQKGYSGVATLCRESPRRVQMGWGVARYDEEGRVIITEHPDFTLYNVYFPNGKTGPERLQFKLDFYEAFCEQLEPRRSRGERLIICGDFNTAHKEIDLTRPKENAKISGFLPVEREWLDKLMTRGYVDTFRHLHPEPGQYTWWDLKSGARARNVGWRIDYIFITENLISYLDSAFISPEVTGSDHCPVGITLAFS